MAEKKPVMDVAKPGETPAEATSRPIIVSKKPAVKDPMVNEKEEKAPEADAPSLSPSVSKKKIEPLSSASKPTEEPAEKKPEEKPDTTIATPDTDELIGEEKQEAVESKVDEEATKRQELVDKLIAEKKYFVPIGAAQHKRNSVTAVILFLVLVAIVGVYLAIDANLIKTDISLPFDLIK